jgi:small conductance mechanosensitive channel
VSPVRHIFGSRSQALQAARRARRQLALLVPLLGILLVAYAFRRELFGVDRPVRLATAVALTVLGWAFARNIGRILHGRLTRGLDPGTAGVAGFTAIVVGLAAQQTIGDVFAGIALLAARPFSVGDRVRFNGFGMSARPRREPAAVDMRARLPFGVDPEAVQHKVDESITVRTERPPHIALEEFDGDEVVVRVQATPVEPQEGGRLARDVLDAVSGFAAR